MANAEFVVIREPSVSVPGKEAYTPSRVYLNGVFFCFCCEDDDRLLEKGGVKVKTRTAIPRGSYHLTVTRSNRFGKDLPELLQVPQFEGVRIHGGNTAENSEGCLLFGQVRTSTGIAKCADTVQKVIDIIRQVEATHGIARIEIK